MKLYFGHSIIETFAILSTQSEQVKDIIDTAKAMPAERAGLVIFLRLEQ